MRLEVVNKDQLTLDALMRMRNSLYCISALGDTEIVTMKPLTDVISYSSAANPFDTDNYLIVKIIVKEDSELLVQADKSTPPSIGEGSEKELEPPEDIVRDKPLKTWERQSYKVNCTRNDGALMIEGRPKGEIRVSFNDKEDAQAWFEHIREIFYTKHSQADAISVANIYDELGLTDEDFPSDYTREEGEKWGYLTVEHGPIKYISEVSKTKNSKLWGFTIKRPIKIYGMTESGWWKKQQQLKEEGVIE